MWTMIPSMQPVVEALAPAFTQPTFATATELMLAWLMCLGKHTLMRVGHTADPATQPDLFQRHGLDVYYNFFERSAWTPSGLAQRVGLLILTALQITGLVCLLVDDSLTHKAGKSVWGLGWFRDAVASTKKRVATASGHNWVVIAIAFCDPLTGAPVLALPLLACLHQPGKRQPSCATLAKEMLAQVLEWFPGRSFTLVGDGAYACETLLLDLPERVVFVGRMRGDAAVYDPKVPRQPKSKPGRKPQMGPRLPSPRDAAKKADRKRTKTGEWLWKEVEVRAYGEKRTLLACSYQALWPRVRGLKPIQIVVVRDPSGQMKDVYLFSTDLKASPDWVITRFAWRWSIEVLFRACKQVMDIEAPQHFCKQSVEKLAPWVWSMQSVIMVWYLTHGRALPEAEDLRQRMGPWGSEWSLRHMVQVFQRATLHATINITSANEAQLRDMLQTLENWALLAA